MKWWEWAGASSVRRNTRSSSAAGGPGVSLSMVGALGREELEEKATVCECMTKMALVSVIKNFYPDTKWKMLTRSRREWQDRTCMPVYKDLCLYTTHYIPTPQWHLGLYLRLWLSHDDILHFLLSVWCPCSLCGITTFPGPSVIGLY